jgi:MFS family permease
MSQRTPSAWPIFGVFFIESVALGLWIPRIPDIKDALGLSDSLLGVALLCMPIGTLLGLALAGRVIDRLGLRQTCRVFLPIWSLLFLIPASAGSLFTLGAGLALAGFAVGMIETAMNTEAARQESASGRRLMSRCHGFWSLGSMFGALLGGLLGEASVSVATQSLWLMPVVAVLGVLIASTLPQVQAEPSTSTDTNTGNASRLFRWPALALVPLCCMPLGLMMIEGAFIDWSAVFARDILEASPLVIAVIYAAFASVMAITRLSGDWLGDRFGDVALARASSVAAVMGIAGFALAPNVASAFFAAAIAGAGVAVVFPLAVSAVARRHTPGRSAADNVAALNMISFSAFLFAPPLIGFLSDATNLRIALLALVPGALLSLYLTRELVVSAEAACS